MADDAIAEQGLTKAEDFIFIEPFFEGREAALAPRGVPEQSRYIGWLIAAAVALIGVVKRVRSVRARAVARARKRHWQRSSRKPTPRSRPAPSPCPRAFPRTRRSAGSPAGTPAARARNRRGARLRAASTIRSPKRPMARITGADTLDRPACARVCRGQRRDPFWRSARARSRRSATWATSCPGAAIVALAYYVKLGLAMLVVGGVAYDPR